MKQLITITAISITVFLGFSSCSMQKVMLPKRYNHTSAAMDGMAPVLDSSAVTHGMMIYDADVRMTVKNADSANIYLADIARRYGGYVQRLEDGSSKIRVKAENLQPALIAIAAMGRIDDKKIYGDDVTFEYTDHTIRLENMQKARQRYLELLAKAENVEAALLVEKELERLNGEIDLLEGKLNSLNHRLAYSTITIYMKEKVKPGILGYIGIGLYYSVKWLFVRN